MKRYRWYSLPTVPTLLIVAVSTVLLSYTLRTSKQNALDYFSYLFSSYALIVGISCLVRFLRTTGDKLRSSRLMQRLRDNDHAARYLDDLFFRAEVNLYFGTIVNALYILIKFFSGAVLRSGWLIAFALYYTVLTVLRFSLVQYVRQNEFKQNIHGEYRRYRLVGILLLGINAVLCGILSRMIGFNESCVYPGILIYAMDVYTFYAVILAIVGLFRFRKQGSPVLSAIKVVNLSAAMVALISLEAAMLQHFNPGGDSLFRHTMLGISGLVVSLILLGISVYMIVCASIKLKQIGENANE